MFYLCLDADVRFAASPTALSIARGARAVKITSPPPWLQPLLERLRIPWREDDFWHVCRALPEDVSDLVRFLQERKYLVRFLNETDSLAAFTARHSRPSSQSTLGERPDRPKSISLGQPGVLTRHLTELLQLRTSADSPTEATFDNRHLAILLPHAYGPLPNASPAGSGRPVPAAGGIPSLVLFVHIESAASLHTFRYEPLKNALDGVSEYTCKILDLCNEQATVRNARAQVTFVYDARTNTSKYGHRGLDFALLEAGHAAQNLTLAATGLGIGSRCIGSLSHPAVRSVCHLPLHQVPVYATALF